MSLSTLESLLRELASHVPRSLRFGDSNTNPVTLDAKPLVMDIASACSSIDDNDLEYASSLLFKSEYSLIHLIRNNLNTKESNIQSAQVESLKFIADFVEKKQAMMQPYCYIIGQCCFAMGYHGPGRVKTAAIETLITLLDINKSHLDMKGLDVAEFFTKFSQAYTFNVTKTSNTAKGAILDLLGTIILYHPTQVNESQVAQTYRWSLGTLEQQLFRNKEAENTLMTGSLNGLNKMVQSSHNIIEKGSEDAQRLYKCIRRLFDLPEDLARYDAPLAALLFFEKHASLFGQWLVEDCKQLYERLKGFLGHNNRDLSKAGYGAINEFMRQISYTLAKQSDGPDEHRAFNYLIGQYANTARTDSSEITFRDLSIAIRGIGYLSIAFTKYLKSEEVEVLKDHLVSMSSWFYSEYNSSTDKFQGQIPAFIHAYTRFASNVDTLSSSLMSTIVRMVESFIYNYARLSSITRPSGIYAIQRLLRELFTKGEGTLRSFLSEFFYRAMTYTCSDVTNDQSAPVYMDFIYFWESILCDKYDRNMKKQDDEQAATIRKQRQWIYFDEFLSSFLKIINAFDLEYKDVSEKDQQKESTDQHTTYITTRFGDLKATNTKDFNLFHNMVQFWCILLPRLPSQRLKDWFHIASRAIISHSIKRQLVSGFYRMLAAMLSVADQHGFFQSYKELYAKQQQEEQPDDTQGSSTETKTDLYSAYLIIRDFLKEVWQRQQLFKDELLSACLQLMLSYPLAFFDVHELVSPIQSALKMGITFYPTATIALDALDKLVDSESSATQDLSFLVDILPLLNEYLLMNLRVKANTYKEPKQKTRIRSAAERKRRQLHFQATPEVLGATMTEDVSLSDIQLRVMRFLGKIGGMNKLLVKAQMDAARSTTTEKVGQQQLVAWDPERRLHIGIPFPKARISLSFDNLLPRICELAESSPDRQVKVAACELLHALVIFMIGDTAFRPPRSTRNKDEEPEAPYIRLYKRVFPILLRLAVDIDLVPRQMFRNLNNQLIHWFTNNTQYENQETVTLLSACLDATCSDDAGLRSYGAECVNEFVKWTIKQQSVKQESPLNIRSLLKRLYNMMSHPSAMQRLGACMVFNKIYRMFREERPLVSEYTLELLYHLFFCLKLAEDDLPFIGTRDEAKEGIRHIRRILDEKTAVFLQEDPNRRRVPGLERADLISVVAWTFEQSGELQRAYAGECMRFFTEFVHKLPSIKDGRQWLKKALSKNPGLVINTFEPKRLRQSDFTKAGSTLLWLRQVVCTLDGYVWIMENDMMDVSAIFEQHNSVLLEKCVYLLEHKPSDLLKIQGSDSAIEWTRTLSVYAYGTYQIVRMITLAARSKESERILAILDDSHLLLHPELVQNIAQMLMLPERCVQAAQAEKSTISTLISVNKVRRAARENIQIMASISPSKFLPRFAKACANILYSDRINLAALQLDNYIFSDMMQVVEGVKILQELKLLENVCKESPRPSRYYPTAISFCSDLFNKFSQFHQTEDPALIQLLGNMLKIAFQEKSVALEYAKELLFDIGSNDAERLALYQKFGEYMNYCIAINFKIFAPLMVDNISDNVIHSAMLGLPKYLQRNTYTPRKENIVYINELVSRPEILQKLVDEWKDLDNLPDLISLFKAITKADPGLLSRNKTQPIYPVFCQGMLTFLRNDVPLAIKAEAFDLLPVYTCIESDYTEKIKQALKETVNRQFPPISKDLDPTSEFYDTYITALDKLLELLKESQSEMIFETLLPIFIQEEEHVHAKAIKEAISIFAQHLGRLRFETVTERCFDYFMNQEFDMLWRRNAAELLMSLLQKVPQDYMFSFYKHHVLDIMKILNEEELRRGTDKEICIDLDQKYCGFRLMEHTLYSRAGFGQQIHGTTSELAMHYEKDGPSANGTKLVNDLLNDFIRSKTQKDPRETQMVLESRRRFQQAAYNAISKAIDRTQSRPKVFAKALFADSKQNPLWQNIVDVDEKLDLKDQFTERMSKKNIEDFRAKSGFRAASKMTNDQYMRSMQLSKSSLAEPSFSQMVLEATGQQVSSKEAESQQDDPMDIDSEVQEEAQLDENSTPEDEYELDQINKNPCMETMVTVIKRLHSVIAKPENYTSGMPEWMTALSKAFNAADTPLNVRVFLARLICNCKYAFAPYAAYWIRPIMKLVIKGNTFGAPINYLVQDLVVLVIVWGEQVTFKDTYDDRVLISDFVHYLMRNASSNDKKEKGEQYLRALKFRVYLIKKLFDLWGDRIIVPTDIILDLATQDQKSRENLAGLQFGGMVLAHGRDIYYDGPEANLRGLTEQAFYDKLAINFHHKYRDVVGDAAEVFAWAIELKRKKGHSADYLEKLLKSKLALLDPMVGQKGDDARFLACLTRIQIHCRDITEQYMNKVFLLLPQLYGNAKVMALQVIGFAIDSVEDPFVALMKNKALIKMLKHTNDQAQSILLGILIKIASTLSQDQVELLLPTLTEVFEKHANGECRSMYYTFLETVNDNLMDTPTPLRSNIKACLLRGLTDQSEVIREGLAAYLRKIFDLNDNVYDRLKAILNMYAPEVEDVYVLYSIHLLLEGTKEAQDYEKPLFDAPLPEAHFEDEDQPIDTSWHYNASMTPLFVLSQDVRPPRPRAADEEGLIRATQTQFEFSLTQSLTGNTLASSYAPPPPPRTSGTYATQSTFGTQASQYTTSQGSTVRESDPYKSLHMRIVNQSKDEANKHFRSMHDKDARTRIQEEKQRRQAQEKSVHLLRKYRVGELPDVQILYKDIIIPLQTLGGNDNETARLLFADLVVSITEQEPSARSEKKNYLEDVLSLVQSNIYQSVDGFPPVIGSFLRICYDLDDNQLDSTVINKLCEKSYNQHIGIALLEKQRILGIATVHERKKARTSKSSQPKLDDSKKHWINLALLYRSIDEPEMFQHLYQCFVATQKLPKDAIDAEISGRLVDACDLFAEAYDKYGEESPESFLWAHERLKCFEQLIQWQDIAATVKARSNDNYDLLWDDDDKDEYMEYFLRSFTKMRDGWIDEDNNLNEWTDDNPNPVYGFLASAMAIPDRQDYLLRNFACDVSINAIVENQFDRAGYYVRNAYDSFLSTWTTLHPLAHGSRMAQLVNLERATEMEGFLSVMSDFQRSTGDESKMTKYIQSLLARYPNTQLDTMDVWDDVIDSRNVMIEELEKLCDKHQMDDGVRPMLFDCRKRSILTMMAAARAQSNTHVAMTRLQLLDELGISGRERRLVGLQNEIKVQEYMMEGRKKTQRLAKMLSNIIKDENEVQPSDDHYYDYQFAAAHAFGLARLALQQDPSAYKNILSNSAFKRLHEHGDFEDATTMANYLSNTGYTYIKDAYSYSADHEDPLLQARCSWKFADYCDNVLRANDMYPDTQVDTPIEYCRIVIQGYFSSMEAGNHHAIERFPRLLELIERYPSIGSVFKERAEAFDQVWMYIRWIPQMVAILDRPIALNIFPALHKLARAYHNALYYPFTISNEHYSSMGDLLPKENRQEIEKLAAAIRSPLLEKLNLELRRLGNPMWIAKDFVDLVSNYFSDPNVSIDAVKHAYSELHDLVLDKQNPDIGDIPRAFAVSHGSLFTDTFGENGSKLDKLKKTDFQNFRGAFEKVLQRERNKNPPRSIRSLKAHSRWLSEFHGSKFDEQLEIPGQYSGKAKPDPAAHAKIISFDERLLPQHSLRRPKRLTMNGSDERQHNFLVKEGEDLRLDQRIQQLFGVMNEILAKDPYCAKHGVGIRTYNVVPMTTRVGMIEWVNDTIPLRSCVVQDKYALQINAAGENYRRIYSPPDAKKYINTIDRPRKDIVDRFERIINSIENDSLRQYLLRMASSPEAFLYIRNGFIHSLAVISISGYVLGIGDRHMENFLVDKKSGELISIDFGHAFGSATEILPIPELMPFRLTRCLTGTLQPLGLGALELVMTHVLQSLHQNRDTLLNVMDVFIKEPLLDWRKQAMNEMTAQRSTSRSSSASTSAKSAQTTKSAHTARSHMNTGSGDVSSSAASSVNEQIEWFPQQKLDTARRKLDLENPAYTMAESVKRNKRLLGKEDKFAELAHGDPNYNYRAAIDQKCPSIREQVKCLIDIATDPAILGRTWAGWMPYC